MFCSRSKPDGKTETNAGWGFKQPYLGGNQKESYLSEGFLGFYYPQTTTSKRNIVVSWWLHVPFVWAGGTIAGLRARQRCTRRSRLGIRERRQDELRTHEVRGVLW